MFGWVKSLFVSRNKNKDKIVESRGGKIRSLIKQDQTVLNWSYKQINDNDVKVLAEELKKNKLLTELNLYKNGIGLDGVKGVCHLVTG